MLKLPKQGKINIYNVKRHNKLSNKMNESLSHFLYAVHVLPWLIFVRSNNGARFTGRCCSSLLGLDITGKF